MDDNAAVPATGEDIVSEGAAVDELLPELQLRVGDGPLAQRRVDLANDFWSTSFGDQKLWRINQTLLKARLYTPFQLSKFKRNLNNKNWIIEVT